MKELSEARELVARYFGVTPLVFPPGLPGLKVETGLPTGSFKVRGAVVGLHARLQMGPVTEVVASSTGNHGAAVAWAARQLGLPAIIFLPANPNPVKRANITGLGARIVEEGRDLAEAALQAAEYAQRDGVFYLDDAGNEHVPLGTGTISAEIVEQYPEVENIYVPMGDTALIRGVARAAKFARPGVRIIGVQAERAPAYVLSWRAGHAIATESCDTAADGLATRTPRPENVAAIRALVDDVLQVSEEEIFAAIALLHERAGVLAEPSGAAATAAWLQRPTEKAVALVTGGNLSPAAALRAGVRLPGSDR
ncbi:MAG: threonine ammonia-lyase [Terriglobales bacterium]